MAAAREQKQQERKLRNAEEELTRLRKKEEALNKKTEEAKKKQKVAEKAAAEKAAAEKAAAEKAEAEKVAKNTSLKSQSFSTVVTKVPRLPIKTLDSRLKNSARSALIKKASKDGVAQNQLDMSTLKVSNKNCTKGAKSMCRANVMIKTKTQ